MRETRELIARYPPDPTDRTGGAIIEGALSLATDGVRIYVLDGTAAAVLHLDLDARLMGRMGVRGEGPGELVSPTGIALGPDGDVWVTDPAAGRLVRFDAAGMPAEDRPAAYPPVNFTVTVRGDVLIPTMSARTLLARVGPDATFDIPIPPDLVPPEISDGPRDRVSLQGLMLGGLPDGSLAMLQNRHGTDFRMWRVVFGQADGDITAVTPLPMPQWLYTILGEETEAVRRTVPEEFAQGDFLVPFKGMHVSEGRLWFAPTPSSRVLAVSLPLVEGQRTAAVVGGERVTRGLIDAVVVGNRLVGLYETELRVYGLAPYAGPFPAG
ncbi:MAG: hypothetical protein OEU54_12385 [Gemmatimonadota bacterium]|nr:hypothetical protein [Gemmatimonadota bacterium]